MYLAPGSKNTRGFVPTQRDLDERVNEVTKKFVKVTKDEDSKMILGSENVCSRKLIVSL